MQSSWTKVRWPISHPADACTSDPRRQVGDTNWQRAPLAEEAEPMAGEGMKVGQEGEREREDGDSGEQELAPRIIKTSAAGRVSGLRLARLRRRPRGIYSSRKTAFCSCLHLL